MLLRFTKMHGLGNDFMMVDLISQRATLPAEKIRELSDRRFGIGFDQLLTVTAPTTPDADFRYTIYNADGSEAEQCGNGARCFLRFVRDQGLTTKSTVRLETSNGFIECRLEKNSQVTVDMGKPELQFRNIPFVADADTDAEEIVHEVIPAVGHAPVNLSVVNVGNPHAVIIVDDVDTAAVETLGPLLESHERFPERVNVGFMQIVSPEAIKLRVFERGVGETKACGTGACAAVIAGRRQGLLDKHVEVELTGGKLTLNWDGVDAPIMMTGPTCRVFEGRLQI